MKKIIYSLIFSACLFSSYTYAAQVGNPIMASSVVPSKVDNPTPGETFDPASGNIQLNYNDMVLPGNGDLPIVIGHYYNHLNAATREHLFPTSEGGYLQGNWDVGMNVPQIITIMVQSNNPNSYFFVQLPGGQVVKMLSTNKYGQYNFVSSYGWKAQVQDSGSNWSVLLVSPKGVQYQYGNVARNQNTSTYYPTLLGHFANVLWIKDTHGNRIDFNYVPKICNDHQGQCSYVSKIKASDGREVDFTYSDPTISGPRIITITANGKSWKYNFNVRGTFKPGALPPINLYQLTGVTSPDNKLWTYWYTSDAVLHQLKNPAGLITRYEFDSCYGNPSTLPSTFKSSLCAKAIIDPTGKTRTWAYHYEDATDGGYTEVIGPNNTVQYHYQLPGNNDPWPAGKEYPLWRYGMVDQINILKPGNVGVVKTDSFTYTAQLVADSWEDCVRTHDDKRYCSSYIYAPMLESKTTSTTDQGTYTTKFSQFDDQLRPHHIEETGDNQKSRTTDLTYFDNASLNLVGGIETKKVDNIQIEANKYDNNTGDLLSHRVNGVTSTYSYDNQGDLHTATDANGNTTTYSDYFRGIAQTTQFADKSTTAKVVNPEGTIKSSTDANGHTTSYDYDGRNRLTQITDPKGHVTTITYDTAESGFGGNTKTSGNLKTITKVDGQGLEVETDTSDLSTGTTLKQVKNYDGANRLVFKSYKFNPSQGNATLGHYYAYDALNRLSSTCVPSQTQYCTTYTYQTGHKTTVTNPKGQASTTTFQSYGDPNEAFIVKTEQPEGITTSIDRDEFGHINTVTQGSLTRKYDYFPTTYFVKSITDPEVGTTEFTYDNLGNLKTKAKSNLVATYHYNEVNQLTQVDYSDGTPGLTKTYYPGGQLKTLTKGNINEAYTYDATDNLTDEVIKIGDKAFSLHYDYDGLDHLQDIIYPDKKQVNYMPDAFGDDTQVGNYVNSIQYYPNGIIQSMQYGNGVSAGTSLNARLLPDTLTFKAPSVTLARSYGYDNNGNIITIADGKDATYDLTLGYDNANRLSTANGKWGQGIIQYNVNGDITSQQLGDSKLSYTIDNKGMLQAVTGSVSRTFSYDQLGNVSNNGQNQFSYGLDGNLSQVKDTSGKLLASYQYDGNGQRLVAVDQGATTYSIYNQAGTLMYEQDKDSSKDYVYLNGSKVAQLENTGTNSNVTYFHNNLLGSPIAATDQSGALLWEQHYQPFGSRLNKDVGPDNPQWYTGKVEDKTTGLMYYGARYYDPEIGRFMAVDPVGFDPAKPITFNRYAYANDNPYLYLDPNGQVSILITISEGAEAGAAFGPVGVAVGAGVGALAGVAINYAGKYLYNKYFSDSGSVDDGNDNPSLKEVESGEKGRNKPPKPLSEADGRPHSIIERPGKDGQYTTHNSDGTWKQYRGSGRMHGGIPRPNVKEAGANVTPDGTVYIDRGKVRPARSDEIPGGGD